MSLEQRQALDAVLRQSRLGKATEVNELRRLFAGAQLRSIAAQTLRGLYFDTALSWGGPVPAMLRAVVGVDHVAFGTDFPYLRRDLAVGNRQRILDTDALSAAEKDRVLGGTALTLIPRLEELPCR
jgi:aminocarboxymuconate-semialdehyde decarboxylase